jgi:hypothetical protein
MYQGGAGVLFSAMTLTKFLALAPAAALGVALMGAAPAQAATRPCFIELGAITRCERPAWVSQTRTLDKGWIQKRHMTFVLDATTDTFVYSGDWSKWKTVDSVIFH